MTKQATNKLAHPTIPKQVWDYCIVEPAYKAAGNELVFVRSGHFYEPFDEHAKIAARELGLALTSAGGLGMTARRLASRAARDTSRTPWTMFVPWWRRWRIRLAETLMAIDFEWNGKRCAVARVAL